MTTAPQHADRKYRLSDGQALGALGAYLVFRTVTQRIGLGAGTWAEDRPWIIPLLNNSSILLFQAGTGTTGRPGMFVATFAASVFLSTVAGTILYWAGWRFSHKLSELAAQPGSPWATVWNPKQIARAEGWMDRWGIGLVFFAKIVEFFTLPVVLVAGASEMRFRRFILAHTAGAMCFAGLFLWIGSVAQRRWNWLGPWIKNSYAPWALRIGLVLIVLLVLGFFLQSRVQKKSSGGQDDETTTPSQPPSDNAPSTD